MGKDYIERQRKKIEYSQRFEQTKRSPEYQRYLENKT